MVRILPRVAGEPREGRAMLTKLSEQEQADKSRPIPLAPYLLVTYWNYCYFKTEQLIRPESDEPEARDPSVVVLCSVPASEASVSEPSASDTASEPGWDRPCFKGLSRKNTWNSLLPCMLISWCQSLTQRHSSVIGNDICSIQIEMSLCKYPYQNHHES